MKRRKLLLFFTSADHPQRDAVCATLAWLAQEEGSLFECYFDSRHGGIHFGGGHPGWYDIADLRGSTVTGGRHLEMFHFLVEQFDCEAACLGSTLFDHTIRAAGVRIRSCADDVERFYREMFDSSSVALPDAALVVGDGGRPQGISLRPYAFPEVVNRRLLAVADEDPIVSTSGLSKLVRREALWLPSERLAAWRAAGFELTPIETPAGQSVAEQTGWMAERWKERSKGFLIGDPELAARWTPSAARYGWTAIYGIPQGSVIDRTASLLAKTSLAHGRQHHDSDFFKLSKLGVGFQVIDPGSPPFPVIREIESCVSKPPPASEPSDDDLRRWARDHRVLSSLLFWTGMIRELHNLYPLADLLSLTGLSAGLVLTTESYAYMAGSPLELLNVPREQGGLFPRVEPLLTDTGSGVLVAADAPAGKFAATLAASTRELAQRLGDSALVPKGWWAHMDAPMIPGPPPRVTWYPDAPHLRFRYSPRSPEQGDPATVHANGHQTFGGRLRSEVRKTVLRRYFAPLRPYEATRPGPPRRGVLDAVREAGFEYAITKSAYGPVPVVVNGVSGLTVVNQTAGRWDGWSPFHTVNTISDLRTAERALVRRGKPGWLLGAIDTCLWTFTGPVWKRGTELDEMTRWLAKGGDSGEMVNVTPRTVARYAAMIGETDAVAHLTSA